MRRLGAGNPPLHRFRIGLEFAVSGHRDIDGMVAHHAAMARALGEQLGLPPRVLEALGHAYEQWDGRGWPGELEGEDVPIATRIAGLAEFVEVAHRIGGVEAAKELARKRAGTQFDPTLAEIIVSDGDLILAGLDDVATWDAVVTGEPALAVVRAGERFDAALAAIANFIDLKSPYFLGHATAVTDLVAGAAAALGLPEDEVRTLRRAGLVHDFGRLGVSNAIWDKRGPLGAGEWERVRLQPYLTERMLKQSESLAPLGALAVKHRERLDGSGVPARPVRCGHLDARAAAGAAYAYQAMREPRPHREALSSEAAAAELRAGVRAGRLDAEAAEAVLVAAGHRVPGGAKGPPG